MKFFKQRFAGECQITAIQTVLSAFPNAISLSANYEDIKRALPKHSYGNTIEEIREYLNSLGLKTKVYKYSEVAHTLEDSLNVLLINIDWFKVKMKIDKVSPHYIVVRKTTEGLFNVFDGSNFSRRVERDFSWLLRVSKSINQKRQDGKWLEVWDEQLS